MCRFKFVNFAWYFWFFKISIHHMCRFKLLGVAWWGLILTYFNTSYVSVQVKTITQQKNQTGSFQYIICVGSSRILLEYKYKIKLFQYIICVGSSAKRELQHVFVDSFQYIICVGSSLINLLMWTCKRYFNTSYVSVQA